MEWCNCRFILRLIIDITKIILDILLTEATRILSYNQLFFNIWYLFLFILDIFSILYTSHLSADNFCIWWGISPLFIFVISRKLMFEEQEEEKTFHNDAFIDNNDYIPYPYFFAKLKKSFCRYQIRVISLITITSC